MAGPAIGPAATSAPKLPAVPPQVRLATSGQHVSLRASQPPPLDTQHRVLSLHLLLRLSLQLENGLVVATLMTSFAAFFRHGPNTMKTLAAKHIATVTWLTALAILTAQLLPQHPQQYIATGAELLCWLLVLVWCAALPRWKNSSVIPTQPFKWLPWLAAGSITMTAVFSLVVDSTWLIPILTPALVGLRRTTILSRLHSTYPKSLESIWIQSGLAAASVFTLAPLLEYAEFAYAIGAIIALLGLLVALIRIFELDIDLATASAHSELSDITTPIAYRATALLAIPAVAALLLPSPAEASLCLTTIWAGCVKAVHWLALIWIAQHVPWDTATAIWTCAAASKGALNVTAPASLGLLQILSRLVVAFVAILQTINFLPKLTPGRYLLLIFAIWPMIALIQNPASNMHLPSLPGGIWSGSKPQPVPRHPIAELVLMARSNYAQILERQSRTLEQAEVEYRKRYSRDPPPGFDKWFEYARSHGSVLIDEFDMIDHDLKPFWEIPPATLMNSINHVSSNGDWALRKCGFTNGEYHQQGDGWIISDFGSLLHDVAKDIPDVEFAFDVVDEPREIITQAMLESKGVDKPEIQNANHKSIWDKVTAPCQGNLSKAFEPTVHDYGIPFVQDWSEAKDVCQHPEFERMHGFFASPETCMLTDAPVPIISQAAPSSFGDIMYPSPWYTAKYAEQVYVDEEDPEWEKKANTLYWAGSTTGSRSTSGSWKYSHRQRFVKLVKTVHETAHKYLKEVKPGSWESYEAKEDVRNLFNVKLTAVIQCDDADCEEQKQYFEIGEKEERSAQFHSRFIFDTDGNAFSGRYYTLLQSRSVVLKQTVLREWHDERLFPWVHYVPVSLSMEELPEIMKYMTSNEDGKKRAQEIAAASREWQGKVLRREDFTIYLYRLMLEMARIMDPKREATKRF